MKEKKNWIIGVVVIVLLFLVGNSVLKGIKEVGNDNLETTTEQKSITDEEGEKVEEDLSSQYPRLTEETMDKNLVLNCEGGDEVVLWDLPTSAGEGARSKDRVPCGIKGWAFNQYYNESLGVTFYAINTLDKGVDNVYGWVTEDLITWVEEVKEEEIPEWYGKTFQIDSEEFEGLSYQKANLWESYDDRTLVVAVPRYSEVILKGYRSDYDYCQVEYESKVGWCACAWVKGLPDDMKDYWDI